MKIDKEERKNEQKNTYDFSHLEYMKRSQIELLSLLKRISNGKFLFQTTLEELTENFYENYQDLKKLSARKARNLKSRIRCKLDYFITQWQPKNERVFFEVVSKKCANGCAANHTKNNPNPDIITIKLNF